MSEPKINGPEMAKIFIKGIPFYLTKDNRIIKHPDDLKGSTSTAISVENTSNKTKMPIKILPVYKEETIYESVSKNEEYLKGEFQKLVLKNRLHRLTNSSRTTATYFSSDSSKVEKTSVSVTNLIGQKNYDSVFVALCSVISQDLKIRAMLALLTQEKSTEDVSCQTDFTDEYPCVTANKNKVKVFTETSCQTDEVAPDLFNKKRFRIKRKVTPFVVKEDHQTKIAPRIKKIIIDPNSKDDCDKFYSTTKTVEKNLITEDRRTALPDLKLVLDEDSNSSLLSNVSMSNVSVCSSLLKDQEMRLLNVMDHNIKTEKNTQLERPNVKTEALYAENLFIVTYDGTKIAVPVKPEDQFHLATPEILKNITSEERKKLVCHQAFIDWKLCLETDDEGNMPIHLAVLHQDLELIWRQGRMLKSKHRTVDEPNSKGLTALKLSIQHSPTPESTSTLMELGADPLLCDQERQTAVHLAAEASTGHLRAVLLPLDQRARQIISDHEELQFPGLLDKPDVEIARHLFLQISLMCDSQGYTPLMLASKIGNFENVKLLVERSPETVNTGMPNSGNTALAIAVAEACLYAVDSGNKAKVSENYKQTIEILLENGADPEIENHSGTKVSDLLQEFNLYSLSLLISNKVSAKYIGDSVACGSKNFDAFMLVKDAEGNVKVVNTENEGEKNSKKVTNDTQKVTKRQNNSKRGSDKPVILENVPFTTKKHEPLIKRYRIVPRTESTSNTLYKTTLQGAQTVKLNSKKNNDNTKDILKGVTSTIVDVPSNIIIKTQGNFANPVLMPVTSTASTPVPVALSYAAPISTSVPKTSTVATLPTNSSVLLTLPNMADVPVTVMEKLNDLNKSPDNPPITRDTSKMTPQGVNSVVKIVKTNNKPVASANKTSVLTELLKSDSIIPKRKASGPLDLTVDEVNKKHKKSD